MPLVAYRVVMPGHDGDEWFDDAAAAEAAVADRLQLGPAHVESLRKPISVDPVVVRRGGARWRSRRVWNFRAGDRAVRVFEMLQIDEALYDH